MALSFSSVLRPGVMLWRRGARSARGLLAFLPAGSGLYAQSVTTLSGATAPTGSASFYWQAWWLRLAALGALLAAAGWAVRWHFLRPLRARLWQVEQRALLHEERERISRDLHDDLGSYLAHIKLLSENAAAPGLSPEQSAEHLHQITLVVRRTLESLDGIVWMVNPNNDTLPSLVNDGSKRIVDVLRAAGIRCQADLPDIVPEIPITSTLRHQVRMVIKEGVTNVIRHARAQSVLLRVTIADDVMRVVLADDGCSSGDFARGRWSDGLNNMRNRMISVGGTFQIHSAAGEGTRIELAVPVNAECLQCGQRCDRCTVPARRCRSRRLMAAAAG